MSQVGASVIAPAGAPAKKAAPAAGDIVVVRGVSKSFQHPNERIHTLKEHAVRPFRRRGTERFEALHDVSFSVKQGEFFGIVGRNGSGKSTLLKCMAGIYGVDRGEIEIGGRLSTFIELGVGFNPDLAARDNVILNGIMLGLTPREARARFDAVIEFAELEDFVDLKLKNYSSGMQVRLAFSVMIQVDADVLLIDEVLAVGDAAFQQKCFDVFYRLKDEGKTILFVTHDMPAVQRFCDRAVLLERGVVRLVGDPERVANHYVEVNFGRDRLADEDEPEPLEQVQERFGSGAAEILEAWFEDEHGERTATLPHGVNCSVHMRIRFHETFEYPSVAILLENELHQPLFATSNADGSVVTGLNEAGSEATFSVRFENLFSAGRIYASPWITARKTGLLDRRPRLTSAIVTSPRRTGAIVEIPHEMSYDVDSPSRSD
jgi:ABC-type polysaccharide/polyol phosphate transport system ATPase subunit